jgi:hypothetical protein
MENNRIVITGSLKQVSLFDLVNFLKSTGKTGVLTLVKDAGRGYFYFRQGQIINIMDEVFTQGEHLAMRYFRWQDGNFEFSQAEVNEACHIKKDTDTLLFDIARSLDEELKQPSGSKAPSQPEETVNDTMAQLRDIFSKAIKRSKDGGVQPRQIDIHDIIKIIRDNKAYDITVRAGRPPLMRKGGEGLISVGAPLSGIDVVRLLDQIMSKENYAVLHEKDYFRQKTFETASGDIEFLVVRDIQGYTITFRLIEKDVPKIAEAGLSDEQLKCLFDGPGLLLISGATPTLRANLFAALIDWLNEKHNAHILLVSERLQWAFMDDKSVVTQIVVSDNPEENVAKLRAVLSNAPRFLAYNATFTSTIFDILLDFCHEGGCVLLSVRGSDVEALARQVSQATTDKSSREVLIRTRALIYAESEKATHIKFMSSSDPTKLTRVIQKEQAPSKD